MQSPYGSWKSPIDTDLIVSRSVGLSHPVATDTGALWSESRPGEGGRNVLVERATDGTTRDCIQSDFNVRSRVHEYGGGAWTISSETLWFVNDHDQRIYQQTLGRADSGNHPRALTRQENRRYADLQAAPDGETLIAVREEPGLAGAEPVNCLVMLTLADSGPVETVIAKGEDFYASPRFSSDGKRLAWLSWNHPNMPWDQTTLWVADRLANGSISTPIAVAGGNQESIFQPQWATNGELYFVSDRSGWWNLYAWSDTTTRPLLSMSAEFGLPQWVFGMSTYGVADDGRLLCSYSQSGRWHLGILDPSNGDWQELDLPYTEYNDVHVHGEQALVVAASPGQPPAIMNLDLRCLAATTVGKNGKIAVPDDAIRLLRRSMEEAPDPGYVSIPRSIDYRSIHGEPAHALYYPPCNKDYEAANGELPPLLVRSHGGPTAATSTAFNAAIQFWTSRGFAVLDVNYGGSTGYGRKYRERLDSRWGETDVDDCVYGARFLIEQGLADPSRCAIRGSSAGGYTTLAALTFRDLFRAGASLYGISDLEALVADTHKFESRYLDRLVGPYPEQRDTYRRRSPIHFPERLSCPIIFFQGLQDKVVPPSQAEAMVQALRDKGVAVAYLTFANEQHGFRDAATIKTALEAELYFYGRIFGFEPADDIPPITIDNLPGEGHCGATD